VELMEIEVYRRTVPSTEYLVPSTEQGRFLPFDFAQGRNDKHMGQ